MARFEYTPEDTAFGTIMMPHLQMTLRNGDKSIDVSGLVDSGAQVNIMPYEVGLRLGAYWHKLSIGGNVLGPGIESESKLLCVIAENPLLPEKRIPSILVFRWTKKSIPQLIFGQCNFFAILTYAFIVRRITLKYGVEIEGRQ